jgi:hypothetical protein
MLDDAVASMATRRDKFGPAILALARPTLAVVLAVAVFLPAGASPTAAASTPCSVKNARTGQTSSRLQRAVRTARRGDRLKVKGVCGGKTVIAKDLHIIGVRTRRTGWAVLNAHHKRRVLTIKPGAQVTIRDLFIQKGTVHRGRRLPDGILNRGHLTLRDVIVRRNEWGGGTAILNRGVLRLFGDSRVEKNEGDGIVNTGRIWLGGRARVRDNGLTGVDNSGTLVMNGHSDIGLNGENAIEKRDGSTINTGKLVMNDDSSISRAQWGAVHNHGKLVMNDRSRIDHNRALGICRSPGRPGRGGGVENFGTVVMRGSSRIDDNTAGGNSEGPGIGGGLYSTGGTLIGVTCGSSTGANVRDNDPDDCHIE